MAEIRDHALLLRRIPFSDTSFICHLLTEQHGRITVMARGARRPKSAFRGSLEPLYSLHISWRTGRSGMGTLVDIQRGHSLMPEHLSLHGLELLALASRLFQEGDLHSYAETQQALALLASRGDEQGLQAAVWTLFDSAGWLGDLFHCWQCDAPVDTLMSWQHGQLVCPACGNGMPVSVGLRKSIQSVTGNPRLRLHAADAASWSEMIRQLLVKHEIRPTDSFKEYRGR